MDPVKRATIEWLTDQIAEALERRDSHDSAMYPLAYGYWDGVYQAHSMTLAKLTSRYVVSMQKTAYKYAPKAYAVEVGSEEHAQLVRAGWIETNRYEVRDNGSSVKCGT